MGLSTKRKLACFLPQVFKPEGTARVVRLGSDNKGGHVVAADAVASTRNLLSLGLAPNFDFEIDFAAMAPILCAGVTTAPYATTTEVYPDSPSTSEEQCNRAQVANFFIYI